MPNPIRAALLGAGNRGESYGNWALANPKKIQIVALADPDILKQEKHKKLFALPKETIFTDWQDLLNTQKDLDAVIVALPDREHEAAAILALEKNLHMLLEKPAANTLAGALNIFKAAEQSSSIVMLGYVLRYTPFFQKVRELVQSGALGEIVNLSWRENVSAIHMSHSFVRGNWSRQQESSPMILAKCSHDLDLLGWILQSSVQQLSGFAGLHFFKPQHAPTGAPLRCLDGCPAEKECAFFAPKIYLTENTDWPTSTISVDTSFASRQAALETGPYGGCVFHAGNDVVDHQVVSMKFENGASGTLTMHGHSGEEGRSLRIDGTKASLRGVFKESLQEIVLDNHTVLGMQGQDSEIIDINANAAIIGQGHGGGDHGLMAAFVEAIQNQNHSSPHEYLESHLLAFAIEEARHNNLILDMRAWRANHFLLGSEQVS